MTGTGVIVPLDLLQHEYGLRAAKGQRPTDGLKRIAAGGRREIRQDESRNLFCASNINNFTKARPFQGS